MTNQSKSETDADNNFSWEILKDYLVLGKYALHSNTCCGNHSELEPCISSHIEVSMLR